MNRSSFRKVVRDFRKVAYDFRKVAHDFRKVPCDFDKVARDFRKVACDVDKVARYSNTVARDQRERAAILASRACDSDGSRSFALHYMKRRRLNACTSSRAKLCR